MSKPLAIQHDDKLIKIDGHPVTRCQSFGYDTNMNFEDIYEIGNENILESRVDDVITSTVNFTALDWGTSDLFGQLMSEKAGVDTRQNRAVVTQAMFPRAVVDLTVPVLENDVWKRSVWLPNQHLSSFTFNYSVDGNATEQYQLAGDMDHDFPEDYHEMYSEEGTYASNATFTVASSDTGKTGDYISVNNLIYDSTHFSWSGTTVTVSGTAGGGALASGDRFRLAWHDDTPVTTFTKLSTAGPSTVRTGQVKIGLGSEAVVDSAHKTLRVQSVNINGTVEREENRELGTKQLTGRTWRTTNIEVQAVLDMSDLQEVAIMQGVSESDWNDWANQAIILYPQRFIGNEQELMIQIYDDADQSYLLKTIIMENLSVTGKGHTHDVQGKEQVTFTLRGSYITVSGNGVPAGSKLAGASVYPSIWV